jgi:hypothetical protein
VVERFHRRLKDALRARLLVLTGLHTCHGFCWALGPRIGRTPVSPPPSWFTAALYLCPANFSPAPSNHRPLFFAISTLLFPAWRTTHTTPRSRLVHVSFRRRPTCM